MSRQIKQMMISELQNTLHGTRDLILVDISRVDAVTMNRVRLDLASSQLNVLFVRNGLALRALSELCNDGAAPTISGPTALVFGQRDATEMSKILVNLAADNKNIKITSGVCEGQLVSASEIDELAKSPSREEIISTISGLILSPGSSLSCLLSSSGSLLSSQFGNGQGRAGKLTDAED